MRANQGATKTVIAACYHRRYNNKSKNNNNNRKTPVPPRNENNRLNVWWHSAKKINTWTEMFQELYDNKSPSVAVTTSNSYRYHTTTAGHNMVRNH